MRLEMHTFLGMIIMGLDCEYLLTLYVFLFCQVYESDFQNLSMYKGK